MKYTEKLKKKLCKEIDEIAERNDMRVSDIEMLYKMTDIVKNLDKIEMLEGEEGSYRMGGYDDMSMARGGRGRSRGSYEGGSYDDDESYARRGQHYVKGHYSYEDGSMRGGSMNSNARGRRYSRGEAKDEMLEKMGEMMHEANGEEREILKHAMRKIEEID